MMNRSYSRRTAIASGLASVAGLGSAGMDSLNAATPLAADNPPSRTITRGPLNHWFGYYDKWEFDPTGRYVLSNQVAFEHRTPRADDTIRVGMVDLEDNDRWIRLGSSSAWGWQQGCMLQWRPGSNREVVWNDRQDDMHVCRVLDVKTRKLRTLPRPIYALSPDGKSAITADFSRIQRMRPGYGYVGLEDPCADQLAPEDSGVWKMDMDSGQAELIFSLADAAAIPYRGEKLADKWHYFNHLLVSPDSSRFIVLHRWRKYDAKNDKTIGGFITRMITANVDGSGVFVLDPSGYTSHFIWRDAEHVCMWTKPKNKKSAFYLFKDKTRQVDLVGDGVMTKNGHNTYLPISNYNWILNDTYPDQKRNQNPYLYHVPSKKRINLGGFLLPKKYSGEWRCDTHPRSSNDGRTICIDSPHLGNGRQLHLINIEKIIESIG